MLKNELEIKWLRPSQAAFKSSHGEFGHLCFLIVIQRSGSHLKLLFSIFLQVKKILYFYFCMCFKIYQLVTIIANSLISRPDSVTVSWGGNVLVFPNTLS